MTDAGAPAAAASAAADAQPAAGALPPTLFRSSRTPAHAPSAGPAAARDALPPTVMAVPPAPSALDMLEPMREAAREFDSEMAAGAPTPVAASSSAWLPADQPPCTAGPSCVDQDEIHFTLFSHPRALLEKKGLVAPMQERIAAMEAPSLGGRAAATGNAAAAAAGHEEDLPPPVYEDLEEVRALEGGAGAAHAQAAAMRSGDQFRPRLTGPFGGASVVAPSQGSPAPPSPATGSARGADGLRMLSELMDEAARDAEHAGECTARGQKEEAVDLYNGASAKLLSLVEANAADLGTGALRKELDARVAQYRESAAAITAKLKRARVTQGHAVRELRDTERTYLKGLEDMERIYHAQIRADLESVAPVTQRHDEEIVFGQLKALISHSQQLHRSLCAALPEQAPGGPAGDAASDVALARVLGVLETAFAGLDVYQKYVEKLGEAQSIADTWARDDEV